MTITTKLKWLLVGVLLFVGTMLIVAVNIVQAQAQGPIELQPYYHLNDGEYGLGRVWALDSGWLIDTSNGLIYTCGCEGCDESELLTYETSIPTTNTPSTDPTPVPPTPTPVIEPTPTPEPEDKAKANCGPGNGPEGADPNENACGKKTGEENE